MFHAPDNYQNASLRLSEVFNDIGVNERKLIKRRRSYLLRETIETLTSRLLGHKPSVYLLGSQSEGTTTSGLNSDQDVLYCCNKFSVIQDWAEWSPGKDNVLMIQDETTPPGYCYLQFTRPNVPLPITEEYGNHFVKDTHGRVLIKNTLIDDMLHGHQRQGPSLARQGVSGVMDLDQIIAFRFKSLPQSVRHWLDQEQSRWPTAAMKRYALKSECFVVPTGSTICENKDFQWRISTSLAERCFMFNLNITQIRCYILLKMILKTFINLHEQKHITSYMCKTILFHCIRSKPLHVWKESNILHCLTYCLSTLNECILCGNCPHFIIPGNNLMAGKVTAENKHQLLKMMSNLKQHTIGSLCEIQVDNLGQRLLMKLNIIPDEDYNATFYIENAVKNLVEAGFLAIDTAGTINESYKGCLFFLKNKVSEEQMTFLSQTVVNLVRYHNEENMWVQAACRCLTPFFCATLGSVMTSYNIQHSNPVSPEALKWLSAGINSDVSSSRLKIASVFYCVGDMERAALILRDIEERYNVHVAEAVCGCNLFPKFIHNLDFCNISSSYNEEALKYIIVLCVRFLSTEINCIPKELQYEMFRSTEEGRQHRGMYDGWMDLAVVDSIPYLYFLQYKTYGYLHRVQDQQQALRKLIMVTLRDKNLGHRETAWNLLGQCMEHENRLHDALQCYRNSLHVRQTNNVARFHICMLLTRLVALANR